jgi:hypothetical protein
LHDQESPPQARRDGLLEETVGEELLLYDQNSHVAHCLSPIAACVWRHCDGEHDVTELSGHAGVSKSLVADALHELREKDLLDTEPQPMHSTVPGISRREAIIRGVRVGAAVAATPLIVSATAATPAMASSGEACKPKAGSTCCICTPSGGGCQSGLGNELSCRSYCLSLSRSVLTFAKDFECA